MAWLTAAALAGCAAPASHPGRVVTMGAGDNGAYTGYPPPGTVWRLPHDELQALGPIVPPPDPPPAPPPPREPPPPPYVIVPSFGYFGSDPGFGFGFGFGSGWYDPFYWRHRYRW
jgi:hypothetical protein